jgi:hypothetical protein
VENHIRQNISVDNTVGVSEMCVCTVLGTYTKYICVKVKFIERKLFINFLLSAII